MAQRINSFGELKPRTWGAALFRALVLEAILVCIFIGATNLDLFKGADNPLIFYFAFVLQLPASLLFDWFFALASSQGASDLHAMLYSGVVTALLQTAVFATLFKRPWLRGREQENAA